MMVLRHPLLHNAHPLRKRLEGVGSRPAEAVGFCLLAANQQAGARPTEASRAGARPNEAVGGAASLAGRPALGCVLLWFVPILLYMIQLRCSSLGNAPASNRAGGLEPRPEAMVKASRRKPVVNVKCYKLVQTLLYPFVVLWHILPLYLVACCVPCV